MNKLKPKGSGKSGGKTSINSIASLIRNGADTEDKVERKAIVSNDSKAREEKHTLKEEESEDITISCLENVDKDKYNCKGMLYVDDEIKEVFSLLKSKGKIQTSLLVSVILEKWLEENKEEVQTIINNGKNRFL